MHEESHIASGFGEIALNGPFIIIKQHQNPGGRIKQSEWKVEGRFGK